MGIDDKSGHPKVVFRSCRRRYRICQSLCVNGLGFVGFGVDVGVVLGVDVGVVFGVGVGFWFCCWGWVAREGGSSPSLAST
jgi:hypothetical protein